MSTAIPVTTSDVQPYKKETATIFRTLFESGKANDFKTMEDTLAGTTASGR